MDASLNICQEVALLADMENHILSNIRKIVARQIKASNFLSSQYQ